MRPKLDIKQMLKYRRPARSKTEQEFIRTYLDSIPGMYEDRYGNRILANGESPVMISTHTDTVHSVGGFQRVVEQNGLLTVSRKSGSNCLGADDTAGIYAALRMIDAGVPATFVFHRDEERGGRGSQWLADSYPEWIEKFKICLALDRRGKSDIITSQWYERCASNAFAKSLADELGMKHSAAAGVFTDSANYTYLIPECSNLSIGYADEHTVKESLDLDYLERVIDRLILVKWHDLSVERTPSYMDEMVEQDDWDDDLSFNEDGEPTNCAETSEVDLDSSGDDWWKL